MNLVQAGMEPINFASSAETESQEDKDLLNIVYRRTQRASPEFTSLHEGIDQSVDIRFSTFMFRAAPEPVLMLYDFIMTTFVSQSNNQSTRKATSQESDVVKESSHQQTSNDQIRVAVKLAGVQGSFLSSSCMTC
jgi:vacuolar protein sorting-associated protein 13A/C